MDTFVASDTTYSPQSVLSQYAPVFLKEESMAELDFPKFGKIITCLINKENLSREEAFNAFSTILNNHTSEIQQGAFLAALTAKGETKEEIAGCWEAIYKNDTVKVFPCVDGPVIENSGTGMDTFKTFNISTAASIIAAAL